MVFLNSHSRYYDRLYLHNIIALIQQLFNYIMGLTMQT